MYADVDSAAIKQVRNHEDVRRMKVSHPLTGNIRHDKKNNVSNRLQDITSYIKNDAMFWNHSSNGHDTNAISFGR